MKCPDMTHMNGKGLSFQFNQILVLYKRFFHKVAITFMKETKSEN